MGVLGRGLLLAAHLRGAQLDRACRDPRRSQERVLRALLRRLRRTAFGRTHRLDRVRSVAAFQGAVPVRPYEDLAPWIQRAFAGEPDVVWPGRIPYYARSSGTSSGRDKLLPITADAIAQQRRGGFDPLASWLRWTGDGSLLDGQAIFLTASSDLDPAPAGARVGVNTGIMADRVPFFVRHVARPTARIRRLRSWDEKIDRLVEETLFEDVRLVAGTPSWFPALFDRLLQAARARGLRADTVRDVWPNLRMLTGGGVNVEPYRPLLEAKLGGPVCYVDVYNSTEAGVMGVQDRPDDGAMRLLPDAGTFYEFVPLDEIESPRPRRLPLWAVRPGVTYAVVVTTLNGLASYAIGDCIQFVEVNPHRFVFVGRTAAFLNVHGEKLSQRELEQAIRRAAASVPVEFADFTVSVDLEDRPRHVWLVEVPRPEGLDAALFARRLDDALLESSRFYRSHRVGEHGLHPPVVRVLPAGSFERWMAERGRLGGQNKIPRVVLDPDDRARLERFIGV